MPEAREQARRQIVVNCHSQETIGRRRATQKRNWDLLSPADREERLRVSVHSEVAKEASREAHRESEYREKVGRIATRVWESYTLEEKEEILANGIHSRASREAREETGRTPEHRAKMSELRRRLTTQYWAALSPEEKAKKIRGNPWFHSFKSIQRPNGPESVLWKFLGGTFPGIFIPDWIDRLSIGGRYPDFWTRNGYKLVIESFGTYYHGSGYFEKPSEEDLVANYEKYGWDCIVVWADSAEDTICEWPELAGKIRERLLKGGD